MKVNVEAAARVACRLFDNGLCSVPRSIPKIYKVDDAALVECIVSKSSAAQSLDVRSGRLLTAMACKTCCPSREPLPPAQGSPCLVLRHVDAFDETRLTDGKVQSKSYDMMPAHRNFGWADRFMRFKGFDLNLLITLQKLIETQSVTATARELNLSQPAVSGALRYLRRHFKDDILIQTGNRMAPTPIAVRLAGPLAKVLTEADALLTSSCDFEPAKVQRRFVIQCSDCVAAVVLAPALRMVAELAPGLEVTLSPLGDEPRFMLERGMADLLIMPAEFLTEEHPSVPLLSDRYVVIGWKENPVMAGPISDTTLASSPRIAAQFGDARRPRTAISAHLTARHVRGTAFLVPGYGLIPHFLVQTDRLAIIPLFLARLYAKQFPLAIQELASPFGFTETIQYNKARSHDSGLLWLVTQLTAASHRLQEQEAPFRNTR